MDESLAHHKLKHSGEFSNFKTLSLLKNTIDVDQNFQNLSHKVYSIFLQKFDTFALLVHVMGVAAITL